MLTSQLFQSDRVLQAIADDRDRMSRTRHFRGESVTKLQTALLSWDPGALPRFGADGVYGNETARTVRRFKIEELSVPPGQVIDDVGPRTVIRLDEIQAAAEAPPPPPAPSVFVRRDVWTLQADAPWDPITIAYARAVRTMQARPMSDPTSWSFQAALHATFVRPANPVWNGCQHASWFFLPWHRMYLFFFEKIVRAAVIADGGPAHFAVASGILELQPHNVIHTVIGGPRPGTATGCAIGQMTDPRCAALDPIFWLHHANIDRLWNRWLDLGGGRANPADNAWLSQRFDFFDETGDRKSTRLNSSHGSISYAVFC